MSRFSPNQLSEQTSHCSTRPSAGRFPPSRPRALAPPRSRGRHVNLPFTIARLARARRYTPLHWASINGASGAVHVLLTAGASCDALSHPDGQTALIKAAQYNAPECIERLCRHGADVDVQDTNGRTALHYAARAGSTRCLEELLAAGALVHLTDDRGVTPIRTAASAKSLRSVHLLALAGATMPNLEVALDSQPPRANCLGLGNVMNSIFCRVMCVPCDVADAMATTHVPSHAAPTTN